MIQFLEILSVWEIAHRWHGIDPDEADPGKVPRNVRETLRELMLALNVYLNPYNGNNEYMPVEEFSLTCIRKTKFARLLEKYLHEGTYDRDFLRAVFIRQDELPKWCRGHDIALPGFWFAESGPAATSEAQASVLKEAEHAVPESEPAPRTEPQPPMLKEAEQPIFARGPAAREVKAAAKAKARKAALKRHEPVQKIKGELFAYWDGGRFPSQTEAVRRFVTSRTPESLKPLRPSNAERTLRDALSRHVRSKRSG